MVGRASRYGAIEQLAPHDRGVLARRSRPRLLRPPRGHDRDLRARRRRQRAALRSHLAREFTGELDLFNDRAILVNGRAGPEPTRVVRIRRADFRRLVQSEPDIAEIVMRAFILRRVGLLRHGQGAAVLIGPAHSADTLRLQQFLTRNGYPLRLFDTEQDADAGGFLECFSLTAAELPVIVLPGHRALRNPTLAGSPTRSASPRTSTTRRCSTSPSSAPARPGSRPRSTAPRRDCRPSSSKASPPAARPAPARRSRTTSAFPPASAARRWPAGRRCRRRSSAPGSRSRAPSSRSTATSSRTASRSTTAPRSAPAPSSSPPARATASSTCRASSASRARASTTRRPRWKPTSAGRPR